MPRDVYGAFTVSALHLRRNLPTAHAPYNLRKYLALIFLQEMTRVFDGGMGLSLGTRDQSLKNWCPRRGDRIVIAKRG
jgi:hypothetical protein